MQHRFINVMSRITDFFFRQGAWAPLLVLLAHRLVYCFQVRQYFDWFMHYGGGVAITYFFWKQLPLRATSLGKLTAMGRALFALSLGCTMGMIWELVEFANDLAFGTHIQISIRETMKDMVNDFAGAITTIALVTAGCRWEAREPQD